MELCSRETLEKKLNMKALACYTTGGQDLWSTKPIKTLADWKGLLVGSGNPESAALITGLGDASVNMSWTDFYTWIKPTPRILKVNRCFSELGHYSAQSGHRQR
jgi:hypothetical protein